MMFQDCDYILDEEDNFWIVHKGGKEVYANRVFNVDENGDRYNALTKKKYSKVILDNFSIQIFKGKIKRIFKPREFFKDNFEVMSLSWKKIPLALMSVGISKENIGIFGSYMLGFEIIKDVDFIVYGLANFKIIKKNIKKIKEILHTSDITPEHIDYQIKKYAFLYSSENQFGKILQRNWAGIQIGKGVLSTIRFVYFNDESPKDLFIKFGAKTILKGIVVESEGTNFVPRIAFIDSPFGRIRILSYFWMFNSFLKKGEEIKICGDYCEENKTIYLSDDDSWIKYLGEDC
ncbi:hypothetical protein HN832_00135 [archaeon]|jgi:predicted nucleotidyltransferase|nr:hypothetical protein [archaeon]MBT4531706.1 hypothetical protein [archaeon]MBT7001818.1 hypothetical protein [archaeon]MBT7281803.1 hypothetical protein [archaeon]